MGRRILKMKEGGEKETWTGGSSSREAEIAQKWETLDKMKNEMENG